jgi:transposase
VLGVDDFATRQGQNYATLLINISTRKPVDVLPDRDADTLADHPEIEVITRDGAGAYTEAATRGPLRCIPVGAD